MRRTAPCAISLAALGFLFLNVQPARAHCDTLTGPVVIAAKAALEAKELQPVLKWVKPAVEAELRAAFQRTLAVRAQGGEARELADRYFLETVVRLHRAGEGAPYTGLKERADDPGGLIAASDRALETATAEPLVKLLAEKVAAGLRERHQRAVEALKHADHNVDAGRHYVEAYVEYVHYVEAMQQILTPSSAHAAAQPHRHEK